MGLYARRVRVEVVTYDSEWPKRFASVRKELETALATIPEIAIEHVGSTAVPGLAAKSPMLQRILERGGIDGRDRDGIARINEPRG